MRKKLFPMPVDGVIDHPQALAMPPASYGMLMRIVHHYWATHCAPLPLSDDQLFSIARAHRPTWRAWKPVILQVFEAVRPAMDAYYTQRTTKTAGLRISASKGAAVRMAQASAARIAASAPPLPDPTSHHQLGFTPKREPAPPRPETPDKRPPRPVRTDRLVQR